MAEVKIAAEPRTEFGKGAARRTRRENKVPAVIYGHGGDPVHVSLPGHDLMLALKTANALLSLDLDGRTELVIPKAVQRDALKGFIKHVDLLVVKRGEKVTVEVQINVEGELAPGGNVMEHLVNTLPVETEATHIPTGVTVSVEGLDAGHSVLAKDVKLPSGTTLAIDGDTVVIQVMAPQVDASIETAAEGESAEA